MSLSPGLGVCSTICLIHRPLLGRRQARSRLSAKTGLHRRPDEVSRWPALAKRDARGTLNALLLSLALIRGLRIG